jgi:hypothetical protein
VLQVFKFARWLAAAVGSGLLLTAFLFLLGLAITDYLVGPNLGNGLEGLAGEEFHSGQAALRNAQRECGGSGDEGTIASWFLRHKFRVVELQTLEGLCPLEAKNAVQSYRARVQAYTLFMIPTDTVLVQCNPDPETPLQVDCHRQ